MKSTIVAFVVLALVLISVILNSFFVSKSIHDITEKLKDAPNNTENYSHYKEISQEYERKQRYIGLTVSHDDLTNIEQEFNEILGAIEANDEDSLIIAKSRLIGSLSHLRRLSGINADSIF